MGPTRPLWVRGRRPGCTLLSWGLSLSQWNDEMKHCISLLRNLGVSCHTLWQHTPRQLLLQNSIYRSTRFWFLIKKLIHLLLIFVPINSSKNIPLVSINVGVISKHLPLCNSSSQIGEIQTRLFSWFFCQKQYGHLPITIRREIPGCYGVSEQGVRKGEVWGYNPPWAWYFTKGKRKLKVCWTSMHNEKLEVFLHTSWAFSVLV